MKDTILFSRTLDYLKEKIIGFHEIKRGGIHLFTCPKCGRQDCCTFTLPDNMDMMSCHNCGGIVGDLVSAVRLLEYDKEKWTNDEIVNYLCEKYNLPHPATSKEIQDTFKFYETKGFDLVPIQANGKIPIEKDWPNKIHKSKDEWNSWLDRDTNIGLKTGKISGVTVIDIDTKDVNPDIAQYLKEYTGILQETKKGTHYFFQYEPELPKTRIEKYKMDIETDGGQVVIYPSVVDNHARKLVVADDNSIPKMSDEFKKFLMSNITSIAIKPISDTELPKLNGTEITVAEGTRNGFLTSFGGAIRQEMNLDQTKYVLSLINKYYCKPALPGHEIDTIVRSLDKYVKMDNRDLAGKILTYLKTVGEATGRDCKEVMGEKKEIVDKTLAMLVKEGYLLKKSRQFHSIKKAEWKDKFFDCGVEIPFKLPFFNKYAQLNWGDLVVLGSKTKFGKTTIAMNLIKSLVNQGIKPYYISLETGSRFVKTSIKLGLTEGNFFWDFLSDPTKIELEKDAVTIIDWLLIEDKSQTDVVFKYFVEQLFKTNGFLIIFMQLKTDGNWFAPNMVEQFPALAAKYLYDKEDDGTYGKWVVDAIREPKFKTKRVQIPCIYDFDTRILTPLDEIQVENEKMEVK
jgi:hypothetical protein